MSTTDSNTLRAAMRVREDGDLAGAVAMLGNTVDPRDPHANLIYLRILFEFQDYGALQAVTRQSLAALDAAMAGTAGAEYLAHLLRFAERCCLPIADIEAALDSTAAAARADPALMVAWRAVRHRQRHRRTLESRYEGAASLVSLGLNCLPWHLPGRWGLRDPADFTGLFVPFSLAGHTIPGVIQALDGDFADYCTPAATRVVATQRGHEMAMRSDRGAFWNHNRGTYWLKDGAAALHASLADKAEAFRAACLRPDAVFILATCPVEYPEEPLDFLPQLDAALARHTGHTGNRILLSNQTARRRPAGFHRVNPTTNFVYCPYPAADYVWHDDVAADGREGLLFERTFMAFLLRSLLNWGLMERRRDASAPPPLADAA